jgi:hypothetical protein
MKKTFFNCFLVLSLTGSLISCKKEENVAPVYEVSGSETARKDGSELHKTKILEKFLASTKKQQSWRYVRQISNGVDVTPYVPSCNLDNVITFAANGDFIEVEGATKCNPELPDVHDTGYWFIEDNLLKVRSQFLNNDIEILELTPQSLKVKFFYEGVGQVEFWFDAVNGNQK